MLETILNFAIALFIGALVGIEREKKKAGRDDSGIGGIRTFILFAQAGAIAAYLSTQLNVPWIFIGGGMCVTAAILVGYYVHASASPGSFGLTTEIAAVVVYFLGGTVLFGYRALAVALAIATSTILAYKRPMHNLVGEINQDDLFAGLKLLIATFIVLPVLPNVPVDPWGALNPYRIWLLVVFISGLSLVGYIATRWFGPGRALPLTGLCGGLASSTAVAFFFAKKSREEGAAVHLNGLVAGLMLSWTVMFVRVLVLAAVICAGLARLLAAPMLSLAALTLVIAFVCYRRGGDTTKEVPQVPLENPFSLRSAIKFALVFCVVLLVVKAAELYLPGQGLYAVAAVAGMPDVDAIALSMAQYALNEGALAVAATAITIAAVTNTLVKCVLVGILGSRQLRVRVALAGAVTIAAAAATLVVY